MPMLEDFKKFALRGNMIDMAIGFTVGAAFTAIAKSLVDDIIMPPIGLATGGVDFSDLYWVMKPGDTPLPPDATLAQATELGAVTLNYGRFVNNILAFVLVALAMFLIIKVMNRLQNALEREQAPKEPGEPENKACPFCLSTIAYKAKRCPQCTSMLDEPGSVS